MTSSRRIRRDFSHLTMLPATNIMHRKAMPRKIIVSELSIADPDPLAFFSCALTSSLGSVLGNSVSMNCSI